MAQAASSRDASRPGVGGATVALAGSILLSQAAIAVATWVLARRLDAAAMGTYGFLQVTATTIGGVAAFGPGIALARAAALGATGAGTGALRAAVLAAVGLCGVAAFAEFGVGPWLGASGWQGGLTAAVAVLAAVQATLLQGMLGAESFRRVSIARVLGGVVTAGGLGVAAWQQAPLWAVAAWGLGMLVSTLVAWRPPSSSTLPALGGAVVAPWSQRWAFVAALLATPMLWAAQAIVTVTDRREMALLAVLVPLSAAVLLVPSQASQAMIAPMVRGDWARVWSSGAWLAVGAGVVPAVGLAATARWWAPGLLPEHPGLAAVATPLALGVAVQAAMGPFVRFLEARAPTTWTMALNAGWAVLLLGLTWRTPTAVGYATAMAIAFAVHGAALLVACRAAARLGDTDAR